MRGRGYGDGMPWDDATNEFDDVDNDDLSSDEFNEYEDEDECAALRGTSQCDGLCDPQCDWCLVAHHCPDECAGKPCPYDALDEGPMRAISNADTFESRRIRIDTSVRHECSSACAHLDRGEV